MSKSELEPHLVQFPVPRRQHDLLTGHPSKQLIGQGARHSHSSKLWEKREAHKAGRSQARRLPRAATGVKPSQFSCRWPASRSGLPHSLTRSHREGPHPSYGRMSGCDRKSDTRESHRHADRTSHRPHRAHPARSISTQEPHRSAPVRLRRLTDPRREPATTGLAVSLSCHTAITNWADRPGPKRPDL